MEFRVPVQLCNADYSHCFPVASNRPTNSPPFQRHQPWLISSSRWHLHHRSRWHLVKGQPWIFTSARGKWAAELVQWNRFGCSDAPGSSQLLSFLSVPPRVSAHPRPPSHLGFDCLTRARSLSGSHSGPRGLSGLVHTPSRYERDRVYAAFWSRAAHSFVAVVGESTPTPFMIIRSSSVPAFLVRKLSPKSFCSWLFLIRV